MGNEIKTGLYLCTCEGEIGRVIDIDSLAEEASGWSGITAVHRDAFLCSDEGIRKIREDIERLGLDRVMIAACSPFFKVREFSDLGINRYLVERVNIREQCSWVHRDDTDGATRKARTMLRVFLEKLKNSRPLEPVKRPILKTALVIGGGIAGINATLDAAGADCEVFLVERKPFLGGKVAELHNYFPRMCPPSCGLELMFSELGKNRNIHVQTLSEISTVTGSPGNFEILIKTSPRHINERCTLCGRCLEVCQKNAVIYPEGFSYPGIPAIHRALCEEGCRRCKEICPAGAIDLDEKERLNNIKAGAIVLSTGWDPFDPTPIKEFGYRRLKNVFTNIEFEKISKEKKISFDEPKRTAFIQCVGSRDERYLPYCSDVCCMVSIKQALFLKEVNRENEIYIFHNDIRTPGEYEELYQKARKSGIIFIKGIPSELRQDGNKKIYFSVFDTVAGERLDITADMVILAVGMRPSNGNIALKDKIGIALNKNDFIESHLQCYPQDTQREGIFSAGSCRAPMDVSRSIESAGTAAVKALKFFRGEVEISADYPVVNTLKCDVCKRCIEECPFKAYYFDDKGFPKPEISKCRSCGVCMGSCPLSAISLGDLSIEQLSEMIDALDKSYLGNDEPIILSFLCKNDAYRAVDDAGIKGIKYPPNLFSIMVPCSGAVNGAIVSKAISTGIDGVLVAGCPDEECHYVHGSMLAKTRLADISDKLKEMYLGPERVRFIEISRDDAEKFTRSVEDYAKELRKIGRNPLRV